MPTRRGRRRAAAYGNGSSDYQVNQQNAYASMTPAQRADYQQRSQALGLLGLGVAGSVVGGAVAGGVKLATIAATSAGLSFLTGLNPQRVIAPTKPAGTRTRRERGR